MSNTRVKNTNYVSQNDILEYLTEKGVSYVHSLGILSNIKGESNFNSSAIGDNGTSAGLFQHHGTRKDNLMTYIDNDLSNWKGQIDYMLTENLTKNYLSQDFQSGEEASYWFTTEWEKPQNKEETAENRIQNFFSNTPYVNVGTNASSGYTMVPFDLIPPEARTEDQSLEDAYIKMLKKELQKEKKKKEKSSSKSRERLTEETNQEIASAAIKDLQNAKQQEIDYSQYEPSELKLPEIDVDLQSYTSLPDLPSIHQFPEFATGGYVRKYQDGDLTLREKYNQYGPQLLHAIRPYYAHYDDTETLTDLRNISFKDGESFAKSDLIDEDPSYSFLKVAKDEEDNPTEYQYNISGISYKVTPDQFIDVGISFGEGDNVMLTVNERGVPIPVGTGRQSNLFLRKEFYNPETYAEFKQSPKKIGKSIVLPYFFPKNQRTSTSYKQYLSGLNLEEDIEGYEDGGIYDLDLEQIQRLKDAGIDIEIQLD